MSRSYTVLGLFVGCLLAGTSGCDRLPFRAESARGGSASGDEDAGLSSPPDHETTDEEEAPPVDGGEASPKSKAKWSEKVQQKLEQGRQRDVGGRPQRRRGTTCTLFPDSCDGDNEACFWTDDGVKRCAPARPDHERGATCRAANDCAPGYQCVGGRPGTCYETCKPGSDQWGCTLGEACISIYDDRDRPLDWGVCRTVSNQCEPWPDDSCAIGEHCSDTRLGRRCLAYDVEAESGDRCPEGPTDCNGGQACVQIEGVPTCRDKCNDQHPCRRGTCQSLENRPYGYCRRDREAGRSTESSTGLRGYGPR